MKKESGDHDIDLEPDVDVEEEADSEDTKAGGSPIPRSRQKTLRKKSQLRQQAKSKPMMTGARKR